MSATISRRCKRRSGAGCRMLLENPSTYVAFADAAMSEIAFLREVARRTGCGLLLDVNNVYVQSVNHGFDAGAFIDEFPVEHVGEVHLGGHAVDSDDDDSALLIDDHGREVADAVWALYARALSGPKPTLIEWDNDVPAWEVLFAEAKRADRIIAERRSNRTAPANAFCVSEKPVTLRPRCEQRLSRGRRRSASASGDRKRSRSRRRCRACAPSIARRRAFVLSDRVDLRIERRERRCASCALSGERRCAGGEIGA